MFKDAERAPYVPLLSPLQRPVLLHRQSIPALNSFAMRPSTLETLKPELTSIMLKGRKLIKSFRRALFCILLYFHVISNAAFSLGWELLQSNIFMVLVG